MTKHIQSIPLTGDDIRALYKAITGRMSWKTCLKCMKLKLEVDGELVYADGDMSKPKRFVCKDCK